MLRKRERFERTDVPEPGPHSTAIAIGVLIVIFVAVALVVSAAWRRAQAVSHLGDPTLSSSIRHEDSPGDLGYEKSPNRFSTTLLLQSDVLESAAKGGGTLESCRLLVIDETSNTASLVTLPLNMAVSYNGSEQSLSEVFAAGGARACVTPVVKAAGIPVTHVVVSTGEVWDQLSALSGVGASGLVSRASDFLSSLYTDMDPTQMLSLAEQVKGIGKDNIKRLDAPASEEVASDADGGEAPTGRVVVDPASLGLTVGTLVQPQ